jgi:glycosyltransferase involved in cell wall biosynthesis
MNTENRLSIVIPAKNEAVLIPRLLTSLTRQNYSKMPTTRVLVADAKSTDGTPDIVRSFRDRLNVSVIPGGMPAVGRNRGAAVADSRFVLFMDADVEPASDSLIRDAVELAERKQLHLVTTNILCRDGGWLDNACYTVNDMFQYLSRLYSPFATGMFMLFDRRKFHELGGFNEHAQFAEDYLLSKQVEPSRYGIVRGGVYTTNRRFQKMGHLKVATLFFNTAFHSWSQSFFLRDHKYWEEGNQEEPAVGR